MINFSNLFWIIIIIITYYFLYKYFLSKINQKKLFFIGLIFGSFLIIYSIILIALGESLMFCSLIPASWANFRPLFIRNLLNYLIGLSPLIGIFIGVSIFKKNKVFSIIVLIISVISTILSSILYYCVQY